MTATTDLGDGDRGSAKLVDDESRLDGGPPRVDDDPPHDPRPADGTGRRARDASAAAAIRLGDWATRNGAWLRHVSAVAVYAVLSVAATWPMARNFDSRLIGDAHQDQMHSVWILWHINEWFHGREAFFSTDLLYHPRGTSILTDGVGVISGFFSLPFWHWGPSAAYNGTMLVGLTLSGYCMFLLARALGFTTGVALFGGAVLLLSSEHLAGVAGHIEKVFVGLLPLVIWAIIRALDPTRRRWWILAPPAVLLALVLYSGYQFMYGALAVTGFALLALYQQRHRFGEVLLRTGAVAALSGLLVGPLLLAITHATNAPGVESGMKVNVSSGLYAPDVLQFLMPSFFQANYRFVDGRLPTLVKADTFYGIFIETSVTIGWTIIALCAVAAVKRWRVAWPWIALSLACIVLALGPNLRLFGRTQFTDFALPLMLPYAVVDSLPGFEFMRVSGRFMMLGAVGLTVTACFGLAWMAQRSGRAGKLVVAGVTALLLFELWPAYWTQGEIPTTPAFYRELAAEPGDFGVLDLPVAWGPHNVYGGTAEIMATYQMFQMTHRKPIAYGYLSHIYNENPVPVVQELAYGGLQVLDSRLVRPELKLNGSPAGAFGPEVQAQLAADGYRYVVWHKDLLARLHSVVPDEASPAFLASVFPGMAPVYDDATLVAYRVPEPPQAGGAPAPPTSAASAAPAGPAAPSIRFGSGWGDAVPGGRPAMSPATLELTGVVPGPAKLWIASPGGALPAGTPVATLTVSTPAGSVRAQLLSGQAVGVPIQLAAGTQQLTLTLDPGSATAPGGADTFVVAGMDLVTSA